jgi:hypothetical protein
MLCKLKQRCQDNYNNDEMKYSDEDVNELSNRKHNFNNNLRIYKSSESEVEIEKIKVQNGPKLNISNFEIEKPVDLILSNSNFKINKQDKNSIQLEVAFATNSNIQGKKNNIKVN